LRLKGFILDDILELVLAIRRLVYYGEFTFRGSHALCPHTSQGNFTMLCCFRFTSDTRGLESEDQAEPIQQREESEDFDVTLLESCVLTYISR
jgi:hypothetical protein